MASDLRFGLEIEMHDFIMTFREKKSVNDRLPSTFWELPAAGSLDTTMIQYKAVFEPLDSKDFLRPGSAGVNWESDWGFRAVGDSHNPFLIGSPQDGTAQDIGSCIIELQTAANLIENVDYWAFSRQCVRKFQDTLLEFGAMENSDASFTTTTSTTATTTTKELYRWYSVDTFITKYNARVETLVAPPGITKNKFKFQLSTDMKSLADGSSSTEPGRHWEAYFTVGSRRFCDVQLTYQMDMQNMYENMDNWLVLWGSIWMHEYRDNVGVDQQLDPDNGTRTIRRTPEMDVYRTQTYMALWRAAKAAAGTMMSKTYPNMIPDACKQSLGPLITYLLVAGAINFAEVGSGSAKNSFAQLPKTSPSSILRQINAQIPHMESVWENLSKPIVSKAAASASYQLKNELTSKGNLPAGGPWPNSIKDYAGNDQGILAKEPEAASATLAKMWRGTFDLATPLSGQNNEGLCTQDPFCVPWADEVNSSLGATRYGLNNSRIKVLFESRYGASKLNIGFHPSATNFMFAQAYLSLVNCLAPEKYMSAALNLKKTYSERPDVQVAIDEILKGKLPLQQKFPEKTSGGERYIH
jgi:hypothetical protein